MYTLVNLEDTDRVLGFIGGFNGVVGVDTETTGLNCFVDEVLLVQVALDETIFLFNIRKLGIGVLVQLTSVLSQKKCIIHNAKFDMKFLKNKTGIMLPNVYCTMVAESVLNAGRKLPLNLAALAYKYCGGFMDKETRNEFIDLPPEAEITEDMYRYSAIDVLYLKEIYEAQMVEAEKVHELKVIELEMELVPVVASMEYTGIKLNAEDWIKIESISRERLDMLTIDYKNFLIDKLLEIPRSRTPSVRFYAYLMKVPVKTKTKRRHIKLITDRDEIRAWLFDNFNVASTNQVKSTLYELGIELESTDAKVLGPLAEKFDEIKKLLEIREVAKQVSTYGLTFLDNINPVTGRVHTEYFTGGTQTGRFSSSNPNLQNIPTHGGFRECFVPQEGYVFISCDYSQQEYRLAGAVSREPVIINAYKNKSDMHTATAANFFNKPLNEVTKDERSWGKTRNFEIIYGTTEWGLSNSLKSTVEYAKEVLDKYWAGYPTLAAFKEKVEEKILELGYSCTPLGRRRYILEKPMFMTNKEFMTWRSRVLREGFNLIIQGGGADIIKIAMVNLAKKNPWGDKFRILLQIHDELMFEVDKSIVEEAGKFIMEEMVNAEQPFLGEIPAVVEGYDQPKERWTK